MLARPPVARLSQPAPDFFALGSVVIGENDARTTYLQTIKSLDDGPFDNTKAIEMPGNGTFLASGDSVFAGLAEEPTWIRYTADSSGKLAEDGSVELSRLRYPWHGLRKRRREGRSRCFGPQRPGGGGHVEPKNDEILRTVDLAHLVVAGYSLEVWTTMAHDGLVYIPGRWADWMRGKSAPTSPPRSSTGQGRDCGHCGG